MERKRVSIGYTNCNAEYVCILAIARFKCSVVRALALLPLSHAAVTHLPALPLPSTDAAPR